MLSIILYPAILWVILYYIVGENSVPSFRPLFLVLLLASIIATILRSFIGIFAIVPNFIIYSGSLTLFFGLDFKQTLKAVGIFSVLIFIFDLL